MTPPLGRERSAGVLRRIASVVTLALFAATLLVAGSPVRAEAAPKVTGVTTTIGINRIAATWDKVEGASKYVLEVSKSSSMKGAKKATTKRTAAAVGKLKNRTTYYVRVTATTPGGSIRSAVTKVRTTSASTGRGNITAVTGAGPDKLKVSWSRFKVATSLRLRVSYSNVPIRDSLKGKYFEITGLGATSTSHTVTIPASFRPLIGSASANPAYVQVISYNGKKRSTSKIAYGWPTPLSTETPDLRVATYNVTSVGATEKLKGRTWADRRAAVARAITHAGPDVLAVQEATTAYVSSNSTVRHYQDLENVLAPTYRLAYDDDVVGTAGSSKVTKGDHLYYRPDKVTVLASGIASGHALPRTTWGSVKDRYFAWALMRQKATGKEFYVVSLHLERGTTTALQNLRNQVVTAIDGFIAAKNGRKLPVILAGDFNSYIAKYPKGPTTTLIKAGYVDSAAAPKRSFTTRSTTNAGFPSKPKSYAYAATRIDYIFVKDGHGSSASANQVMLTASGAYDPAYYGSDHNLQWVDLGL